MSTTKKIIEETNDDTTVKVAVLNNDIKHINETLARLEGKFDVAVQSFATSSQLMQAQTESDRIHKEHEKAIVSLQEDVRKLRDKDNEQQGAIDANQKLFTRGAVLVTALAAILGALWWLPTLLHR